MLYPSLRNTIQMALLYGFLPLLFLPTRPPGRRHHYPYFVSRISFVRLSDHPSIRPPVCLFACPALPAPSSFYIIPSLILGFSFLT